MDDIKIIRGVSDIKQELHQHANTPIMLDALTEFGGIDLARPVLAALFPLRPVRMAVASGYLWPLFPYRCHITDSSEAAQRQSRRNFGGEEMGMVLKLAAHVYEHP